MAHGVKVVLPLDIAEATYLLPPLDVPASTEDLIAHHAQKLQTHPDDLHDTYVSQSLESQETVSYPVCQMFFLHCPGVQLSSRISGPCAQLSHQKRGKPQDKASFPGAHGGCPSHKGRHIYSI